MSGEIVGEVKSVIGAALERLALEAELLDKISKSSGHGPSYPNFRQKFSSLKRNGSAPFPILKGSRRHWVRLNDELKQTHAQDVEATRRDCAEQIRQQQEAYENRRLSRRLRRLFFG